MDAPTLRASRMGRAMVLTIDRPARHNAVNRRLLEEIAEGIARAEADPAIRVIALAGLPGVFCTGLDLEELAGEGGDASRVRESARMYYRTLVRMARSTKLTVCKVDGRVEAGGVGFAAAADYVLCSRRSTFRLPEVLLGLLPANVLPFLVRRIGYSQSFRLTLTAATADAGEAVRLGLADEAADDVDEAWRKLLLRIERLSEKTVIAMKRYFEKLHPPLEALEDAAVEQIAELLADGENLAKIQDLMRHGLWRAGASRSEP